MYGGEYYPTGAYNRNADQPPVLLVNGQFGGYVTKNPRIRDRIDPDFLYYQVCGE